MNPSTTSSPIDAIVSDSLERRVMPRCLGIDPDRDAKLTLGEACACRELDLHTVMEVLRCVNKTLSNDAPEDETQMTITQLTDLRSTGCSTNFANSPRETF